MRVVLLGRRRARPVPGSEPERPDQTEAARPDRLIRVHARRSSATVCFGRYGPSDAIPHRPCLGGRFAAGAGADACIHARFAALQAVYSIYLRDECG